MKNTLYLPSLDGLRVLAFLLVFVHHSPTQSFSKSLKIVQEHGFVGVELFFVISSYLFFHLFEAEYSKTGAISVRSFLIRRILRLYPLMFGFPFLMLLIFGSPDGLGWVRLAGIGLMSENIITAFKGYSTSILATAHLWTVSFEFQIYLIIPFIFLYKKTTSSHNLLFILVGVLAFSTLLRSVLFALAVPHPAIWVTPFARPDSVIMGIALSLTKPAWDWRWSAAGSVIFGLLFFFCPLPMYTQLGNLLTYPLAALFCGALVDTGLRSPSISKALSAKTLRTLGSISFGLYIYHMLMLWAASKAFEATPDMHEKKPYWMIVIISFIATVTMSMVSYRYYERNFMKLKDKFAFVRGREI